MILFRYNLESNCDGIHYNEDMLRSDVFAMRLLSTCHRFIYMTMLNRLVQFVFANDVNFIGERSDDDFFFSMVC
jgi:hypothetical protein